MFARVGPTIGCALALIGCATTTTRAPSARASVESGDLPAALPGSRTGSDRGHTGDEARVVLGARRERTTDLFARYLRRVAAHDADGLRDLFDDPVIDVDSGEPRSREDEMRLHDRALQSDTAGLGTVLDAVRPTVRSYAELRRSSRPAPSWMQPDDWLIEFNPRDLPGPLGALLPRRFVVRWSGDEPRFVGASRPGGGFR